MIGSGVTLGSLRCGDADVVAVGVHVVEQTAGVFGDEVGLQRPGGVGVPDREGEVRDVAEHHPAVDQDLALVRLLAVDLELHPAEEEQVQPGRGDDHVGLQLLARLELDPARGEVVDAVGDDLGAAVVERFEEVAVGHDAEPLVPGVVVRLEVRVDVVARRERLLEPFAQDLLHQARTFAREPVGEALDRDVLPADDRIDGAVRQELAQQLGDRVFARQRDDVGRRALQHRHVGGVLGHRRDQRHRGRAAADHHHPLALVVGLLGPVLGMDDAAPRSPRSRRTPACSPRRSGSSRCS